MPEILLVRHAMPEIERDVAAERWRLGEHGRSAARALAQRLPHVPLSLASDEPKASQTADEIVGVCGGGLCVDARLAETRRPHHWDPHYRELAAQYVGGKMHPGWEPHEAVVRRFGAAIRDGLRAGQDAPLLVVTHGQALTLWLHGLGALDDPARFWRDLAFPDAWKVAVRWSAGSLMADRAPARVV